MIEFWPELLTTASWKKLQELKKEIKEFTVIGGWAIYLWTRMHKSKDIDIIVDIKTLEYIKQTYDLSKNVSLRKYEVKFDKFDIDVYVQYFSEFVIPIEKILKSTTVVQGFEVPVPEMLMVLKQAAEIDRKGSIKGEKDAIDMLTLLIHTEFKLQTYKQIIGRYKLDSYLPELTRVIANFNAKKSESLGLDFKEFSAWRRKILGDLRKP